MLVASFARKSLLEKRAKDAGWAEEDVRAAFCENRQTSEAWTQARPARRARLEEGRKMRERKKVAGEALSAGWGALRGLLWFDGQAFKFHVHMAPLEGTCSMRVA